MAAPMASITSVDAPVRTTSYVPVVPSEYTMANS